MRWQAKNQGRAGAPSRVGVKGSAGLPRLEPATTYFGRQPASLSEHGAANAVWVQAPLGDRSTGGLEPQCVYRDATSGCERSPVRFPIGEPKPTRRLALIVTIRAGNSARGEVLTGCPRRIWGRRGVRKAVRDGSFRCD